MPDRRIWAKFAQDMPDHPKIGMLSDAAFRCLIEAVLYSRRQLTDGFIEQRYATKHWAADALEELCHNHPDRPSLSLGEDESGQVGYVIHDYAEHQDTAAVVAARRERNAANGAKGGAPAHRRVSEAGLSPAMAALARAKHLDPPVIVAAIATHVQLDVTPDQAITIAVDVLHRAHNPPKRPQSYVLAAIKQHPDEIRSDIDTITPERQD